MNARVGTWSSVLLLGLLTVAGVAQSDSQASEEWLAGLRAANIEVRDRALAQLPNRLLDPQALAIALQEAERDPEVAMRLRACAAATPFLAPSFAGSAFGSDAALAARSRELFVELLTGEVARRASADRLLKRSERTTLFTAGDYVGALPPLEQSVPFERGVAWLAASGGWDRPVALDPVLAGGRVAALEPPEWWPSTAGGMLKRWLSQRTLDVIDLGIVTVITTDEQARAFARADREAESASHRAQGFERRAAEWLAGRILSAERDPAAVAARFRLWLALGLPDGSAAVERLRQVDREALQELRLLALLERARVGSEGAAFADDLGRGSREDRAALLFEFGRGPRLPDSTAAALAQASRRFELAYLECKRRCDSPAASSFVGDLRTDTAQVLATLVSETPERISGALDWLESPQRVAADCDEIAIAMALALHPSGSADAMLERLLASKGQLAHEIGWYLLGARTARGEPIPAQGVSAGERRAFFLGVAFADVGRSSRTKSAVVLELAPRVAATEDSALLAYVRAIDAPSALAAVGTLRVPHAGRLLLARALVHRCVVDVIEDDDRLATRLLFDLRRIEDDSALLTPLYDDAAAAFSAEERGRLALVSPIDRLWLQE